MEFPSNNTYPSTTVEKAMESHQKQQPPKRQQCQQKRARASLISSEGLSARNLRTKTFQQAKDMKAQWNQQAEPTNLKVLHLKPMFKWSRPATTMFYRGLKSQLHQGKKGPA